MTDKVQLKLTVRVTCLNASVARAIGDIIASKIEGTVQGATDDAVSRDYTIEADLEPL